MNYLLNKCIAYNFRLHNKTCECTIKTHLKEFYDGTIVNIEDVKNRRELIEFISLNSLIENPVRIAFVLYS